MSTAPFCPFRFAACLVGAAVAVPCVAVALAAFGVPAAYAWPAGALVALLGAGVAWACAPGDMAATSRRNRLLFVVWLAVAAVAVVRVSSLAVFEMDVSRTDHAFQRIIRDLDDPELTRPFFPRHNCATCYVVAAHLAERGAENIYDQSYYEKGESRTPVHDEIGGVFNVDRFQYPPPFLLGPALPLAANLDFFQIRSLWFVVGVSSLVLTALLIAVWIRGWSFGPHWLIWPAVLVTPVSIATLQIGNVHAFVILIAVLSMICFERRRPAVGGVLLAYATLTKLFPGVLILFLLLRRQWRPLIWTAVSMCALCVATIAVFGAAPFRAFVTEQLPAMASGEAFGFGFVRPQGVLTNAAIMGIPFKLRKLGMALPWEPMSVATTLTWVYTLAVITVVVVAARDGTRSTVTDDGPTVAESRLAMARVWAALLVLAQARSPFLPAIYGNVAVLLLLALLLPLDRVRPVRLVLVSLAIVGYGLLLPLPFGPRNSSFDYAFGITATLVSVALATFVAVRSRPALAHESARPPSDPKGRP